MTTRRFAVEALPEAETRLLLPEGAARHARDVLRLRVGQAVIVFDGAGSEADASIVALGDDRVEVLVRASRSAPLPAGPRLHVLLGLPKGPAMDAAVRMATELGVASVRPVVAERSMVRPERPDRWRRVAASAAAQCGRSDLPVVHPASGLRDALAGVGGELWVAVPGAGVPAGSCGSELTVAVGPEGGWSASEEALLRSRGSALGLGPWVLRTDTAVTAALAAARALVTTPR